MYVPVVRAESSQIRQGEIEGLAFERNNVAKFENNCGWFNMKIGSSPGPLISDFVTHELGFTYSTYGIHVGQDDRLTFLATNDVKIRGEFVDCRAGSPTHGHHVQMDFFASPYQRLIIPRGVAHTFDGLEGVVTRDEPIWYSDIDNVDWNVDNDLISIPRERAISEFPTVKANRYLLPQEAHFFMSRLSQKLLENPKNYLARYRVEIAGKPTYVMLEPKAWQLQSEELAAVLNLPMPEGMSTRRARYAGTGPDSWTLVPTTDSCVADVLHLAATEYVEDQPFAFHVRTRKYYTFLSERVSVSIEALVGGAAPCVQTVRLDADPRVVLVIEPGTPYRLKADKAVLVRCEHEVFVAEDEPRSDLPAFAADLQWLRSSELRPLTKLPTLKCPPSVVQLMARSETI